MAFISDSNEPSFPVCLRGGSRPVIGISGANGASQSVLCMMQMIHWAGAIPLLLCEHKERTRGSLQLTMLQDLSRIHGLIVMGKTMSENNGPHDSYEKHMIEMAIKIHLPLLGICDGMQRIHTLCGGVFPHACDWSFSSSDSYYSEQFIMGVQPSAKQETEAVMEIAVGSFVEHAQVFLQRALLSQ